MAAEAALQPPPSEAARTAELAAVAARAEKAQGEMASLQGEIAATSAEVQNLTATKAGLAREDAEAEAEHADHVSPPLLAVHALLASDDDSTMTPHYLLSGRSLESSIRCHSTLPFQASAGITPR